MSSANGSAIRVFMRKQCADLWCSQCLWVQSPRGPRPHIDNMTAGHWAQSRCLSTSLTVHDCFDLCIEFYLQYMGRGRDDTTPCLPGHTHCFRVLGSDRIARPRDTVLTLGLWNNATILVERILVPPGPWEQPTHPPSQRMRLLREPCSHHHQPPPQQQTLRLRCADGMEVDVSHPEPLVTHADFFGTVMQWNPDANPVVVDVDFSFFTIQSLVDWLQCPRFNDLPSRLHTNLELLRAADQFLVHGYHRYGIIRRLGQCIRLDEHAHYVRDIALGLGTFPELVHLCDLFLGDVELPPVYPNAYYSGPDLDVDKQGHGAYYPADPDPPRKRPRLS